MNKASFGVVASAVLLALGVGAGAQEKQHDMTFFISSAGSAAHLRPPPVRDLAGFRNRGHGSRGANPPNVRSNLPSDKKWNDQRHLNLGSQYTNNHVMGSVLFQKSGLPQGNSRPVQIRVNGQNRALPDNRM